MCVCVCVCVCVCERERDRDRDRESVFVFMGVSCVLNLVYIIAWLDLVYLCILANSNTNVIVANLGLT